MSGDWDKLVSEHGLEGAKDIMRQRTKLRKISGFAAMTPERRSMYGRKGGKAIARNGKTK